MPGQLGTFDAEAARKKVPADAPNRERILRQIAAHDLSARGHVPESYGGGFVVDSSGLVLTNAHVVKNATRVYVRIEGKGGRWANIHASDPRSDLAVLKLIDPPKGLKALPMGDGGKVERGQFVLSLSFYHGDDGASVRYGMIAQLKQRAPRPGGADEIVRHKLKLHHYGTLLQTNADITPGASGGALLDLDGKAVGLVTALAGVVSSGGLAIPLNDSTKRIIEVLKRGEEVEYGFLGVVLDVGVGRGDGVRLVRVSPGCPAARAGLLSGDVIVEVDGNEIRRHDDLFLHVGMGLAGRRTSVVVERRGRRMKFNVVLAKGYVPGPVIASKRPPAKYGLRVDWSSIAVQRNPFARVHRSMTEGVVVREVRSGSPADDAKLQLDSFITHVNDEVVRSPAEFYEAIKKGTKATVTVARPDGKSVTVTLEEK
jgi:serine protease Do